MIDEDAYNYYYENEGDSFVADLGASAVKELLAKIDLNEDAKNLRAEILNRESKVDKKQIKRLEDIYSMFA